MTENAHVWLATGIIETEFIKYDGTYGDSIKGNVDASFCQANVHSSVSLKGKESSKLQSSFGSLKKEEVDVQKLMRDCKDRWVPHLLPLSRRIQFVRMGVKLKGKTVNVAWHSGWLKISKRIWMIFEQP